MSMFAPVQVRGTPICPQCGNDLEMLCRSIDTYHDLYMCSIKSCLCSPQRYKVPKTIVHCELHS